MKIEKFYLFLLACFVAIGAYSQDGQQKMTGDEKSQQPVSYTHLTLPTT